MATVRENLSLLTFREKGDGGNNDARWGACLDSIKNRWIDDIAATNSVVPPYLESVRKLFRPCYPIHFFLEFCTKAPIRPHQECKNTNDILSFRIQANSKPFFVILKQNLTPLVISITIFRTTSLAHTTRLLNRDTVSEPNCYHFLFQDNFLFKPWKASSCGEKWVLPYLCHSTINSSNED